MNLPKTRAEAKLVGASHYFTGVPCKHGHVAPRKTKGACVECLRADAKASLPARAEYFQAYNKSDAGLAAKRRYYLANKDKVIARALTTPNEVKRQYRKAWKDANALGVKADNSNRKRRHRAATPVWLSREHKTEMRRIYQVAIELTKLSGEKHVVGHIVPIRSPLVCGLHVPWNLAVVASHHNATKSNKLPDDSEAVAFPQGRCYNGRT